MVQLLQTLLKALALLCGAAALWQVSCAAASAGCYGNVQGVNALYVEFTRSRELCWGPALDRG